MARGIHLNTGVTRKINKVYVGINGTAKRVKQVYVGINGVPKPIWQLAEDGQQIFTSSGTFTVPDGVHKVDIFCVGGGGRAGTSYKNSLYNHVGSGGGGGAGGYTKTMLGVELTQPSYAIIVGASGGTSSFGSICSAAGGGHGSDYGNTNEYNSKLGYITSGGAGGIGGSAGGSAGFYYDMDDYTGTVTPTPGASNGADAAHAAATVSGTMIYVTGGTGQGSTTRAFGETNGTLYSPGSGGKSQSGAAAGTGAGVTGANSGAGCSENTNVYKERNITYYETTTGYSGIVIVRWKANEQ